MTLDLRWMSAAACAGDDLARYFPRPGQSAEPARRVCRGCAVRAACLRYALARRERYGVWGGLTETERRDRWRAHRASSTGVLTS